MCVYLENRKSLYQKIVSALQKYDNIRQKGRFTNVWKGKWRKNVKEDVIEVAIKQLKNDSHLANFSRMCYDAMRWEDPTLVKVFGATLAIPGNPMALIMEYLPMGPLDKYLKENR